MPICYTGFPWLLSILLISICAWLPPYQRRHRRHYTPSAPKGKKSAIRYRKNWFENGFTSIWYRYNQHFITAMPLKFPEEIVSNWSLIANINNNYTWIKNWPECSKSFTMIGQDSELFLMSPFFDILSEMICNIVESSNISFTGL